MCGLHVLYGFMTCSTGNRVLFCTRFDNHNQSSSPLKLLPVSQVDSPRPSHNCSMFASTTHIYLFLASINPSLNRLLPTAVDTRVRAPGQGECIPGCLPDGLRSSNFGRGSFPAICRGAEGGCADMLEVDVRWKPSTLLCWSVRT